MLKLQESDEIIPTHTHTHTHTHTLYTDTQSSQQTFDDDIENARSGFILDNDNGYGKLVQETDQSNIQHNHKKENK